MPQQPRSRPAERASAPGWLLGRIAGVPIIVARSWLVIAAVVIALFGPRVADVRPDLGVLAYVVAGAYALALFGSVLVHELAHALVAQRVGLPPTHIVINLWGGHTQFESEAATPGRSCAVAAVGPLSNGVVAVLAYLALGLLDPTGVASRLLEALAVTNAFVAAFNIVPGLPLDGGRVLEAAVWRATGDRATGTVVAGWAGRLLAVGIVLAALAPFAQGRSPDLLLVVWAVLIAPMLWSGAGQAIASARVRRRAQGLSVAGLARPAGVVPLAASVDDVLGVLSDADAQRRGVVWVLAADGSVVGALDPRAAMSVPPQRRAVVAVGSVAAAHDPRAVIGLHLAGDDLVNVLRTLPGEVYAVVDRGRVVASLHATDVLAALSGTPT